MKTILKGISTALIPILLSVPSWGQESGEKPRPQIAYENALLDSAYRYEKLKLAFTPLKTAYEFQGKENEELRNALRLQNLQIEMQKQNLEAARSQEIKKARRSWWRGFRLGIGLGVTGGILLGLKL